MKTYCFASATATAEKVGATGRLFKKQILPLGEWVDPLYPEDKMVFTRDFLQRIVDNHKLGIAGRVPVPDTHTDETSKNKGELVDVALEDDGLYGFLDIRDEDAAESIDRNTTWDVSAKFTDDYQDKQTGTWFGPTLLHVALVNNPYIKKMNPFKALSEAMHQQFGPTVRMLSESNQENSNMPKLKNERNFPVEVTFTVDGAETTQVLEPGQEVELSEDRVEAVTNQLTEATAPGEVKQEEDAEEVKPEEEDSLDRQGREAKVETAPRPDARVEQLSDSEAKNRELSEREAKVTAKEIELSYDSLLRAGKIVPAAKDDYMTLASAAHGQSRELSDGRTVNLSEALAGLMEKLPRIVALDEENGKNEDTNPQKTPWEKLTDEQRKGLQASNITPEQYNANGGKNGFSILELNQSKEK